MKIAVIGGAGARAPLLVQGLAGSDLPLTEVALYDVNHGGLALIGGLARQMCPRGRVTLHDNAEECVFGSDFVFLSIRVGGIEGRARDEEAIIRHGLVGQETIGAGGFAMAMRTIPPMLEYVDLISRVAPEAWIINFTNPVSIITQAVYQAAAGRIIGICDTPTELFEEVAHTLGVPSEECYFDFFGLNHLGWLREVFHRGGPLLGRVWSEGNLLEACYRNPLFETDFLRAMQLLPTEYLYYYYRPEIALANLQRAESPRGRVVAQLNARLLEELDQPDADRPQVYRDYLAARDAGYMEVEVGSGRRPTEAAGVMTGYDRIAMAVVRGIHFNSRTVIPLNVPNAGNFPFLDEDDIVEVPCLVTCNGALPLSIPPVPGHARSLMLSVKSYERATVAAARSRKPVEAQRALAANPLIPSSRVAEELISELGLL